jgi:MFS family permease
MLKWYIQNFGKAPERLSLLLALGLLYALELANLLSVHFTSIIPKDRNCWVFTSMIVGGLVFSYLAYQRKKWDWTLQTLLRLSVLGQAVFMLLQGFALHLKASELFLGFRCGWGFFFVASFGLIISLVMRRVYPRQRTFACAVISLTGLLLVAIFLAGMAAFQDKIEQNNPFLFYFLGTVGIFMFILLLFKTIPFGEPIKNDDKDNSDDPIKREKLLDPKIWQTLLPLIGIGLFTYYVFELVVPDRLISFGFKKDSQNLLYSSLAVRYLSTFFGTALSCWLSFRFKRRKLVLRGFMILQLLSLLLLAYLFYLVSPAFHFSALLLINALLGFSTGIFLLSILTAAESFGNRLRPVATIFLSSMYRGSALLFTFGLATFPTAANPSEALADFAIWFGGAIVLVGIFSVWALDSSNFDGNADLSGFDYDIFDHHESNQFFNLFEDNAKAPVYWKNQSKIEKYLEGWNEQIFNKLKPIFGDWLYHCVLYHFDSATGKLTVPTPKNNDSAWEGLDAKEHDFRRHLAFAKEMITHGDMASLIYIGFTVGNLQGVVVHNCKKGVTVPSDFACFNLLDIALPSEAAIENNAFSLLASDKSYSEKLDYLLNIEKEVVFGTKAFDNFRMNGFQEEDVQKLRRILLVRRIEALPMPEEYVLYIFFPKGGLRVSLAVLVAKNEMIYSKQLQINSILSGLLLRVAEMDKKIELEIGLEAAKRGDVISKRKLESHFVKKLFNQVAATGIDRATEASSLIESVFNLNGVVLLTTELNFIRDYCRFINRSIGFEVSVLGRSIDTVHIPACLLLNLALNSIEYNKNTVATLKMKLTAEWHQENKEEELRLIFYDNGKGFLATELGIPKKTNRDIPSSTDNFLKFAEFVHNKLGVKPTICRENCPNEKEGMTCRVILTFPQTLLSLLKK